MHFHNAVRHFIASSEIFFCAVSSWHQCISPDFAQFVFKPGLARNRLPYWHGTIFASNLKAFCVWSWKLTQYLQQEHTQDIESTKHIHCRCLSTIQTEYSRYKHSNFWSIGPKKGMFFHWSIGIEPCEVFSVFRFFLGAGHLGSRAQPNEAPQGGKPGVRRYPTELAALFHKKNNKSNRNFPQD